jgi:hypothetical protein
LIIILGSLALWRLCTTSCATTTLSKIYLPLMNALCSCSISLPQIFSNLLVRSLPKILKLQFSRLMGQSKGRKVKPK